MVGGELVCYFTSVVEEQIQLAAKAGLELGASGSQVERSIRSATLRMLLGQEKNWPIDDWRSVTIPETLSKTNSSQFLSYF